MKKRSVKNLALAISAALLLATLGGCGNSGGGSPAESNTEACNEAQESAPEETAGDADAEAEEAGEGAQTDGAKDLSFLNVGTCVMSFQQEFMINLCKGYEEFAKQTGINWTSTDGGNNEPEKQATNTENLIESGVDTLIVQCVSVDAMADLLNSAGEKGINVAYYPHDDAVTGAKAYLGYDEYDWGHQLGEAGAKWMQENYDADHKPVIINLTSSQEKNSIERCRGMQEAVAEVYSDFEWIKVEAVGAEEAMTNIEAALQAHPDTDMILCYNDNTSTGAYQAAIQSGLDLSKFLIGSCDGTDTVLDLMKEEGSPFRVTIGNAQTVPEIGFGWMQNIVKCTLGLSYDEVYNCVVMPIWQDEVDDYLSKEVVFELDEELVEYMNNL